MSEQSGSAAALLELAERSNVPFDAVEAFIAATTEVLGESRLTVATARRAALLAASEQTWDSDLGPMFSDNQVRDLLPVTGAPDVADLVHDRRIIAIHDKGGSERFPAFQFINGQPSVPLANAFWTLVDAPVSEWTAASWCIAPDDALAGKSPVRWVREGHDPERLVVVAKHDAARLAR